MKKPVPANIEELKPYIAGKTIAEVQETYQPERISKLASNENRLGHSKDVEPAVIDALKVIHDYPDPVSKKLVNAIAKTVGTSRERLLVGAGSESLLSILFKTFFHNGQNVITADATFIGVYIQAKIRGVRVKRIPLNNEYRFDIKGIVNAIDQDTRMIYIANPNNPTGTYINQKEFEWFMKQVPSDVLVVMDEAYYEFAESVTDYPDVLSYDHENVIVLRTFSKAYGLAGFRVGYAIAAEKWIEYMHKTKLTFEPGSLGQAAALASIKDQDFLDRSKKMVNEGRELLYRFFDHHGVVYAQSVANFVMIDLDDEETAIHLTQEMLKKGVILRRIHAFGLPSCIRVTIGTRDELEHFMKEFELITDQMNTPFLP